MRMKARPLLHYAPVPGGVYFSGARTQFVMRGWDLLFRVADVCVPLLESGATEDELVAALGTERARPAVRHLTTELHRNDMLLDVDRLTVAEPPDDVRAEHAEFLAYLEAVCADPYAVFARLRVARVLLVGPAEAVQPAARGLTRAGVENLVLRESAADAWVGEDVDAALYCCGRDTDDDETAVAGRIGGLPEGVPVVPVLLDDRVILAGPVIHEAAGQRAWQAFTRRASSWARAERPEPPTRPVADALAGALAGHLLFEALAGLAIDGAAHVVHGAELVTDRVVVDASARPDDRWHPLERAESTPMPEPDEAVHAAGTVAGRWTGLFSSLAGEDLPQLPLALRQIEYRDGQTGSVVAWGREQQSATVGVALEALRASCAGAGVGAAGLTEEHWLLDGALRLLVDHAQPLDVVAAGDLDAEALRIWQSLCRHGADPLTVRVLHVPGLDWRLCRVEAAGTGGAVALGWGVDASASVVEALGTALARMQVERVTGAGDAASGLRTDALLFAGDATVASLREQVTTRAAVHGVSYRGRAQRADPVLGEVPFWFGPVEAHPLRQEPTNAH